MKYCSEFSVIFCLSAFFFVFSCYEGDDWEQYDFKDLSAFRSQAGNWRVVGAVSMDSSLNVDYSSRDSNKYELFAKAVNFHPGDGVLLNINSRNQNSHLISKMEHGDIDLELELMVPRGSNSGVYLQGRYEVQILDSWGVANPKFSDIGGIYENWEKDPERAFRGKAPDVNASKAPGDWQKLEISFRAPEFDSDGIKIKNALFKSVKLNGIEIQKEVELPWTTGAPLENNEVQEGPIVIQGDHGPVAFRNFRYKTDLK